jgi:hypothetical protein
MSTEDKFYPPQGLQGFTKGITPPQGSRRLGVTLVTPPITGEFILDESTLDDGYLV